jgi:hypothetical protein
MCEHPLFLYAAIKCKTPTGTFSKRLARLVSTNLVVGDFVFVLVGVLLADIGVIFWQKGLSVRES